jgi:peptidoglycan/LPS O-acetylase OafA/YrhL
MKHFRADVEGLRAVAISIVVLAHAGLGFGAGGYVGVDVFFVISGFLITQLLVGELDRSGQVAVGRFYARRVKRLMPQVLTAIAAVAVAASVLLSPVQARAVASDVVAAGTYAMNWHLSAEAVDYFASTTREQPLEHLWSLAVEEQFYLVWPWLLLALARVWRRGLPVALAAVAAASFAYALLDLRVAPEAAYYSAFARAWELALGALLAVLPAARARPWVAWPGLAAIGAATVAFGAGTPFPGPAALVPTLGAAAVIAAGASAPARALTLRPVRWVGRVSYAWYVWHWPVLVFAGASPGPLPAWGRAVAAAASLVPAWASHRWIEEPLRRSNVHLRRPRLALAAGLAGPAIAVGLGIGLSASLSSPRALAASDAPGAPALARTGTIQGSARALRPRPIDADADRGRSFYDGCLVDKPATTSPACTYGDRRSPTTVVLFGDSHAMQWFPALERIARGRWRLVEITKSGCPPQQVHVSYPRALREYAPCDTWREYALRRIERVEHAAMVIVSASVNYTVMQGDRGLGRDASTRALAGGYAPTLARLRAAGGRVVVLADPPRPPWDIPSCVSAAMRALRRCAFARGPAVQRSLATRKVVGRLPEVRVIDATSRFCLRTLCPAVIGNVLVYRNTGHVTASYMQTLSPWLERRLR